MSLLHNTFLSKQSLLYPMSLLQSAFIARARMGWMLLVLWASVPLSAQAQVGRGQGMLFDIHLVAATLTTGVFLVALLLAVVLYMQAKYLHNASDLIHEEKDSWISRLPPMLAMERLLVRVLVLGFVLLSGLILTGMFFGDRGEILGLCGKLLNKIFLGWIGFTKSFQSFFELIDLEFRSISVLIGQIILNFFTLFHGSWFCCLFWRGD